MPFLAFKPKPQPPPKVPTDEVIPFHHLDDQPYARAFILNVVYRFDDVLSPEKLKGSLERLLEMDGWRKLGARVRLNADRKLEHHIPERYTPDRPAINFSHAQFECSIEEHTVARELPRAISEPTILRLDPKDLSRLTVPEGMPTKFEDWAYTDKAPLSMHIVSFTDATLVTLNWAHSCLDGMGASLLFKAWIAVLEGREEDVPLFQGYNEDFMDKLMGRTPPENWILYNQILGVVGFILFVLYNIWEATFHPRQSRRIVCVPDKYIKRMRDEVLQELATDPSAIGNRAEKPFVSEGDVLYAWWAKITVSALKLPANRPVNLMNAATLRGLVDHALPRDQAYTSNATMGCLTFLTVGELTSQPISKTALCIRRSLEEQRTQENVEAWVALQRRMPGADRALLVGHWNMLSVIWSSWHKARFFELDLSGAVVKPGIPLEQRANKLGRPSHIHFIAHHNGFSFPNSGGVMGKDPMGNWWIHWMLRDDAWVGVEAEMRTLGRKAALT